MEISLGDGGSVGVGAGPTTTGGATPRASDARREALQASAAWRSVQRAGIAGELGVGGVEIARAAGAMRRMRVVSFEVGVGVCRGVGNDVRIFLAELVDTFSPHLYVHCPRTG